MKTIPVLLITLGCITTLLASAEQSAPNSSPATQAQQEEVLNNGTIIELKQLGLGESVIAEKIKSSRCDFDVSLNGLKQLKAAGVPDVIISAMLSAKSPTKGNGDTGLVEKPADPNDPASPHYPGIWLYDDSDGSPRMTQLEPSVYSQSRTGVGLFMQFGQTVKNRAVIRSAHAEFVTDNRQPVFYFYFEHAQAGLSDTRGATSPNEYILAQFEVALDDNQRRLIMGSLNAYSGGRSGTEGKSVRSFSFQKLSPGIYKVSPKEPLGDGEYGFFYGGNDGGGKVFDFGVKGHLETEPPAQVAETAMNQSKKNGFKSIFKKKRE